MFSQPVACPARGDCWWEIIYRYLSGAVCPAPPKSLKTIDRGALLLVFPYIELRTASSKGVM